MPSPAKPAISELVQNQATYSAHELWLAHDCVQISMSRAEIWHENITAPATSRIILRIIKDFRPKVDSTFASLCKAGRLLYTDDLSKVPPALKSIALKIPNHIPAYTMDQPHFPDAHDNTSSCKKPTSKVKTSGNTIPRSICRPENSPPPCLRTAPSRANTTSTPRANFLSLYPDIRNCYLQLAM